MNEITELTRFREALPDDPTAQVRARNRLVSRTLGNQPLPRIPGRRRVVTRRRLVFAAAAAVAVAATATFALTRPAGQPPGEPLAIGPVVVPIAYEIESDPPPAAEYLRDIAAHITDAPYDEGSGQYAYLRYRGWGEARFVTEDGYAVSYVKESEIWRTEDGSGRHRHTVLGGEFTDEESARYFAENPAENPTTTSEPSVTELFPGFFVINEMPRDEAELAALFSGMPSPEPHNGILALYQTFLVPKEIRAAALNLLADAPGYDWRGEVTDRAGRSGVAVSHDFHEPGYHERTVLVFDPDTGALLAIETVGTEPGQESLRTYGVFLETRWTEDPGPEPTE